MTAFVVRPVCLSVVYLHMFVLVCIWFAKRNQHKHSDICMHAWVIVWLNIVWCCISMLGCRCDCFILGGSKRAQGTGRDAFRSWRRHRSCQYCWYANNSAHLSSRTLTTALCEEGSCLGQRNAPLLCSLSLSLSLSVFLFAFFLSLCIFVCVCMCLPFCVPLFVCLLCIWIYSSLYVCMCWESATVTRVCIFLFFLSMTTFILS